MHRDFQTYSEIAKIVTWGMDISQNQHVALKTNVQVPFIHIDLRSVSESCDTLPAGSTKLGSVSGTTLRN